MTTRYLIGLTVFAGAACAADTFHPLDLRPGMWESSMTVQMTGALPIPPDVLAKMTPEQKAMLEARVKARESQPPKTTVSKRCISKEDLDKPLSFGDSKAAACQRTLAASSSSKQEIRIECEAAGMKSNGTVRIEAIDAEHVKVTSHISAGDGPHPMNVDANGTGKWLSATCTATDK